MDADPGSGTLFHDPEYFAAMYRHDPDPWGFDRDWYEHRKHALTVASLPRERYRRAVEPGCANGTLTEMLAARCDTLLAYDLVVDVVERARHRLADRAHVSVRQGHFPDLWPAGGGDLVVLSEVAYYLTPAGAAAATDRLQRWLEPDGDLIAVHYTGETDYPRRGDEIAPWLDSMKFLHRRVHHREQSFDLGVWTRIADAKRSAP